MICLCFVRSVRIDALQTAVRNAHEIFGHSDIDVHSAVGLVVADVLVRPPDTCADALAGGHNEPIAEIVSLPSDAAAPWRVFALDRHARVIDLDLILDAGRNFLVESHPINIPFALEFRLFASRSEEHTSELQSRFGISY